MALVPADLLACVVTTWAGRLNRLDALAVDNCTSGTGLASDSLAIEHDQAMIDLLEAALVAELANQWCTLLHGGKSLGSRHQGQRVRIT